MRYVPKYFLALALAFASSAAAKEGTGSLPLAEPFTTKEVIEGARHYFPDEVGRTWTYSGSISEQVQRVSNYTNMAKIKGTLKKGGVDVQIFSESNQGNRGPAESYFKKDATGVTYFGGDPTTDFEKQLVPYRVIRFPIVLHQPYVQIEKNGIAYDFDLDHDGIKERADVFAEVTAVGFETVSTPAGTFHHTIKFEGKMTIWITLSRDQKKVPIVDSSINWFAPGVGMVKGIEKAEFPAVGGRNPSGTIITEVLESFSKNDSSEQDS